MNNNIIAQNEERWLLLYRNSTKQQAEKKVDLRGNIELDIPNQRAIVRPWAERQGRVIDEVIEGGVSGYKKLSSDRDKIDKIKEMADKRQFDVLGIYMSERLGRIADDTPHIVKYLNDRGIRVISYSEGEISVRTHVDKLKTYITYWQAEGESLKTSQRVTDAGEKNVEKGNWRGGKPPYGYRSISRGRLNFKGRPIFDIEIDLERAEIVKQVFRMYTKEHYGTTRIAKYLNNKDIIPADGCLWTASRVRKLLKNKLYTGIYELGKVKKSRTLIESPVMEKMVIISMDEYNEAQEILKKNDSSKKASEVRPTRRGSLLLTGLLYCNCGKKFTSVHFKRTEERQDGTTWCYDRSAYRCVSFSTPKDNLPKCKNKVFTAENYDNMIIADAKKFISEIDKEKLLQSTKDMLLVQEKDLMEQYRKLNQQITQKEKEMQHLKNEVIKAIMGESSFSKEMLNEMIQGMDVEISKLKTKLEPVSVALAEIRTELTRRKKITEEIDTWEERFDGQDIMDKKAMLVNIIDNIIVRDDEIEVQYKIKIGEEFDDDSQSDNGVIYNDGGMGYNDNLMYVDGFFSNEFVSSSPLAIELIFILKWIMLHMMSWLLHLMPNRVSGLKNG